MVFWPGDGDGTSAMGWGGCLEPGWGSVVMGVSFAWWWWGLQR